MRRWTAPSYLDGHSKIYYAATFGKAALLAELLASATADRSDDGLALVDAAGLGQRQTVRLLLDAGVDPDARTGNGVSAAMAAAQFGHLEVLRLLIAHRADLRATARNGETALELGFFDHQLETVAAIFDADLFVTDLRAKGFRSPAWWAGRTSNPCLARLLGRCAVAQARARP